MKILYLEHYAGSPKYGMEYRPYYMAREWVKSGHEVTIVAASYSHLRNRQPSMHSRLTVEMIDGIQYVWLQTPKYEQNGAKRIVNIIEYLRGLYSVPNFLGGYPFDAVIASSTYPFDNDFAHRMAIKWGAIHVYEVHDLWPLSPIELGGYSRWHPAIIVTQAAEDHAYRNADLVVSLLPAAKTYMMTRGLREDKFHYIPNGIAVDEWDNYVGSSISFWEEKLEAVKGKDILIGYAGSHGIANALDTFIDAAVQLPNYGFVLLGQGPEKNRLQRKAEENKLANVLFIDSVPRSYVPDFLNHMDILYIGFQRQSLYRFGISPNKLMDYMMAGKPIICAIDAGNDIVEEAGCGLTIQPENVEALVQAVHKISSLDKASRDRMGLLGHAYIKKHHDYHILAQQFISILQETKNKKMRCRT
jgi:glycosyltransferase involved in cell wall biosynthesis